MNKYKVGDKIVIEITDKISVMGEPWYVLSEATSIFETYLDKAAEPLENYTEPLEAKIRRQAAEITRLLAENEKLKEEYNQAFNQGTEAAWELARKIVIQNGYSSHDLYEIFESNDLQLVLEEYTYPEAAAKVAEWEKAKAKILVKAGDVLENIYDSNDKCIVTKLYPNNRAYLVFNDGTAGMNELDNFKKTGRHMDIDSFLKQIGGEQK